MKNFAKILLILFVVSLMYIGYQYTKPSVEITQIKTGPEVPVKMEPFFGDRSQEGIRVYIPFQFEIKNNRLSRIVARSGFKTKTLQFLDDGKSIDFYDFYNTSVLRDSLFYSGKLKDYYAFKNREWIFPFSKQKVTVYRSFEFSAQEIYRPFSREGFVNLINGFYEKQKKFLAEKPPFSISDKIIDSLYNATDNKKLRFVISKEWVKYGWLQADYRINSNKPVEIVDYYKKIRSAKSREELFKIMSEGFDEGFD